ncbi:MAG: prepilin-type N-terminal cleavage/methylation domain-containing protein [Planctomycetota bacterium]
MRRSLPFALVRSRRCGFSLLEAMITLSVFGIVMTGFMKSFDHFSRMTEQSSREYQAQAQTMNALEALVDDLSRSAFINLGGTDYPQLHEMNALPVLPVEFVHAPADASAGSGALSNDVWFVLPSDGDGDNWPDLDANGQPVWSPVIVAYVLVPDGRGTNNLERRTSAGAIQTVARRVASLRFEDPAAAGWEVPLETLRIRIETSVADERGSPLTRQAEAVVRLNNGLFVP